MSSLSLHALQLEYLRLLRDVTKTGKIVWEEQPGDNDLYNVVSGPSDVYIHFKWPTYNGDEGSDRDFVDVAGCRFTVGTEGWLLALEILAAAFPTWQAHADALKDSYKSKVSALNKLLRDS